MILNVPKGLVKTLKRSKKVKLYSGKAATTFAFPINNQRGPWKDIRVRKALVCYGVNRKLIVKTALRGLTFESATSTPHFSQITPLCFSLLYLPQRHS